MNIKVTIPSEIEMTCTSCEARCCRLEVRLLNDTGVPAQYIETDEWGGLRMARLDDGWCSAVDRNYMNCMIYEDRPLICREFVMGDYECQVEYSTESI